MEFTASQIAGILEGEIEGNPEVAVHKLAKIEEGEQGSLTFLANPKYTPFIYITKNSITIVNKDNQIMLSRSDVSDEIHKDPFWNFFLLFVLFIFYCLLLINR